MPKLRIADRSTCGSAVAGKVATKVIVGELAVDPLRFARFLAGVV